MKYITICFDLELSEIKHVNIIDILQNMMKIKTLKLCKHLGNDWNSMTIWLHLYKNIWKTLCIESWLSIYVDLIQWIIQWFTYLYQYNGYN